METAAYLLLPNVPIHRLQEMYAMDLENIKTKKTKRRYLQNYEVAKIHEKFSSKEYRGLKYAI